MRRGWRPWETEKQSIKCEAFKSKRGERERERDGLR